MKALELALKGNQGSPPPLLNDLGSHAHHIC